MNNLLGTNTSKVIENPHLIDSMDPISKVTKKDLMKIVHSKHLFYEEMCSYSKLHIGVDFDMSSAASKGIENHEASGAMNDENGEYVEENNARKRWMQMQLLEVKKKKVEVQAEELVVEKERFKWQIIYSSKEIYLKRLEFENKKKKLEYKRMKVQLK